MDDGLEVTSNSELSSEDICARTEKAEKDTSQYTALLFLYHRHIRLLLHTRARPFPFACLFFFLAILPHARLPPTQPPNTNTHHQHAHAASGSAFPACPGCLRVQGFAASQGFQGFTESMNKRLMVNEYEYEYIMLN